MFVILLLLFNATILFLLPSTDPAVSSDTKAFLCDKARIYGTGYLG